MAIPSNNYSETIVSVPFRLWIQLLTTDSLWSCIWVNNSVSGVLCRASFMEGESAPACMHWPCMHVYAWHCMALLFYLLWFHKTLVCSSTYHAVRCDQTICMRSMHIVCPHAEGHACILYRTRISGFPLFIVCFLPPPWKIPFSLVFFRTHLYIAKIICVPSTSEVQPSALRNQKSIRMIIIKTCDFG